MDGNLRCYYIVLLFLHIVACFFRLTLRLRLNCNLHLFVLYLILTFLCFSLAVFQLSLNLISQGAYRGTRRLSGVGGVPATTTTCPPLEHSESSTLRKSECGSYSTYFTRGRSRNCFACGVLYVHMWVPLKALLLSGDSHFFLCFFFFFSFLYCFPPSAHPPVNGKNVQSISIQIGSASSM